MFVFTYSRSRFSIDTAHLQIVHSVAGELGEAIFRVGHTSVPSTHYLQRKRKASQENLVSQATEVKRLDIPEKLYYSST